MKEIVEKLIRLERKIARDRGEFRLFALFLREAAPNRWDLVAAAPWIDRDYDEALRFMAKELREHLSMSEHVLVSGIVLIRRDNPDLEQVLESVTQGVSVNHGCVEIRNSTFFGLAIQHAYIITASKSAPAKRKTASRR